MLWASSIFLQSVGRPVKAAVLSIFRDVIFFVLAIEILAGRFGVVGMLWSAPAADGLSLILTAALIGVEYRAVQSRLAEARG